MTELVPVDDLVFHSRDEYALAANWKIGCENYLECYHCPVAHKGFSAAYDVDPDEYRLEPTGRARPLPVRAHARTGRGPGPVPLCLAEPQDQRARGHAEPLDRAAAAGRARALVGLSRLLLRPDADAGWVEELLAFDRQVGAEDRVLVERVQKGVRSGSWTRVGCSERASSSSPASRSSSGGAFLRNRALSIGPNVVSFHGMRGTRGGLLAIVVGLAALALFGRARRGVVEPAGLTSCPGPYTFPADIRRPHRPATPIGSSSSNRPGVIRSWSTASSRPTFLDIQHARQSTTARSAALLDRLSRRTTRRAGSSTSTTRETERRRDHRRRVPARRGRPEHCRPQLAEERDHDPTPGPGQSQRRPARVRP